MKHRYRMMKKTGALQEGFTKAKPSAAPVQAQELFLEDGNISSLPSLEQSWEPEPQAQATMGTQALSRDLQALPPPRMRGGLLRRTSVRSSSDHETKEGLKMGLFFYTVPEGKRVLMMDRQGRGQVLKGPCRVRRRGRTFHLMEHHVAYPGEFLIIKHRDGSQDHIQGPVEEWLDPRVHTGIEKEDSLQLATKEAVVVYSREGEEVHRRIVLGPAVFLPQPGEWLHTFSWHGSSGEGYRKVPGALVFQKLWLMPDQMYHDVEGVRTSDDVELTVKLMIFFEPVDIEKMLEATHDPIGDFINATSSDVIDLVGRQSFNAFKAMTDALNQTESYPQLLGRATQVGYKINKIVSRGYTTTDSLRAMHEQNIERRTALRLERETEEQTQSLEDFKQERELQRADMRREKEQEQEVFLLEREARREEHRLQLERMRKEQNRIMREETLEQDLMHQQKVQQARVVYLEQLKELGVDLTSYLQRDRADRVIELRGGATPHLHLPQEGRE